MLVLAFALALALAPALPAHAAPSGSYLCSPPSRSGQCDAAAGSFTGAVGGPCDAAAGGGDTPATTVRRGDVIPVTWPRNGKSGGVVRLAWARTGDSDSAAAFDAGVQHYACFEAQCDAASGCYGDTDGACSACRSSVTVPLSLPDGQWTLQWMWYGGGFGLPTQYSCADFAVAGGTTLLVADPPSIDTSFTPGDATYKVGGYCPHVVVVVAVF